MPRETDAKKLERYETALAQFVERVMADRYVLAVVEEGSLLPETMWARHALSLWIIEADGVTRRIASDGTDERVFRVLVSVLVNTTPTDPTTFISICLLLTSVTLLACFVPARRATRLHPTQALRVE